MSRSTLAAFGWARRLVRFAVPLTPSSPPRESADVGADIVVGEDRDWPFSNLVLGPGRYPVDPR
jgi:hypothetical protein